MEAKEDVGVELLTETEKKNDESNDRETWKSPLDFLLNVVGFSVGLGNVWRFSYLCYKNGGGAFLFPYILLMICCGLPLLFAEIAMGQFYKQGCIGTWKVAPIMQGIGYAGLQLDVYYSSYIIVVMGWCFFYLVHSFTTDPLPWSTCDNAWNTEFCKPAVTFDNNGTLDNNTLSDIKWDANATSSVKEFWNNYVLQKTDGIHDIGGFTNWRMLLCFLVSWIASYLCISKGIKSSGKVVYVTVTVPYIMVLVLAIRGLTLEGAVDGILYYVTPVPSRLLDSTVWIDAGSQVLFTLGICYNVLYSCGSYNKFNNDCYKQSFWLILICSGTSICIGFAVFSIIGHMAFVQHKNVSEVAEGGPGLVFEVFPVGLSLLPKSQIWSAVFFAMLILIAIDSSFTTMEGFLTTLADIWPRRFGSKASGIYRVGCCALLAIISLPMLSDGGIYIFEIVNNYGGSGICILWAAFFETMGLAWIYGVDRFYENVKTMLGFYPTVLFKYCYRFVTPAVIMAIFLFYCATYSPLKLGTYEYPWWGNFIGWIISGGVIICIPAVAIKTLVQAEGTWSEKWRYATTGKTEKQEMTQEFNSTDL